MRAPTILALMFTGLSTALAEPFSQATWEVYNTVPGHWHSIVIPLDEGRALLTGVEELDGSSSTYLFEPSAGVHRVADPAEPMKTHFGAALPDGRALVGGGGTRRCFIFDPHTEEWSEAASLPGYVSNFYTNNATALPDGRVLVTGGTIAEPYFDDEQGSTLNFASRRVFLFDPAGHTIGPDGTVLEGSWEKREPMPPVNMYKRYGPPPFWLDLLSVPLDDDMRNIHVGRCTHRTVVLGDGRVLLVGGREFEPAEYYGVTPVDLYDPVSDRWTRVAELPSIPEEGDGGYGGRGFPGVSVLASGEVLIYGGLLAQYVEEVDRPHRTTFTAVVQMRLRRSALRLNPDTGEWRRVGDLNVGRMGPLSVSWPPGVGTYALAVGGTVIAGPPSEVYDPSTETWSFLPPEPEMAAFELPLRQGAILSDGSVVTWSANANRQARVKRLVPGVVP